MSATFELVVEGEGIPSRSVSISKRPYSIGRGPSNDLVVPDGMVSWEHLKIWSDHGVVWCADAGSTNGTFVNGEKINGTAQVKIGDRITVGSNKLCLMVQFQGGSVIAERTERTLALEEIATGFCHPFRGGRFIIGSASDADLRIPTAKPYHVECAIHGPDDVWMLIDNEDRQIELGSEFEIEGMQFRVVEVDIQKAPTLQQQKDRFPYRLTAKLDGPTGPMAELESTNGKKCRVDAETRAVLLYLLGRRFDEDRKKDVPRDEVGWTPDDDVIVGVWGRSGLADGANRLKVLVHRLRAEIERAGFDPWFIERRRRFIRVRIREWTD